MDVQPERAAGLLGQPAEEAEHLIAAPVVAAERPDALGMPDCVVGDQLAERGQVSAAERCITRRARSTLGCSVMVPPFSRSLDHAAP